MKILQIYPIFPPSPTSFGSGPTHIIYHLGKELVKRGHKVAVYTSAALDLHGRIGKIDNPVIIDGIEVYYFSYVASYYTFFATPGIIPAMRKSLKHFDIIHLHDIRCFQSIICHHYAKKYSIPYVVHTHGSPPRVAGEGKLKWLLDIAFGNKILRDASRVIAITQTEVQHLNDIGVSEDKIELVPNAVDLSQFENLPERGEFRSKHGLDRNQKIILYLGRIHKIKGLDLLTEAFANLPKEIGDARLVIVGPDDGYLPALKKLIKESKIAEKVLYIGPLYGEEKLKAYIDADVYVLPSIYETFPMTVLEACACATPVIVTDRCQIADLVRDNVGFVVPYDKDRLRDAILNMLTHKELRMKFGERGRILIKEQYNCSHRAEQIEAVYKEILAEHQG